MKKNVVLGVSGGIAVYKSCYIVSGLRKLGYDVKVVMTKNSTEFVTPLTFETLSKNAVIKDMFAEKPHFEVEHVSLAKWAGAFVVAPATADVIAKFAEGICDDMLSTTFAATEGIKVVCPAMNTKMYMNEANLKNIQTLKDRGVIFIDPAEGLLACGDVGIGRMEEPEVIIKKVDEILTPNPDLRGHNVLITAGPTVEDIDGVRFISNYSSGKMGLALCEACIERGANVTVVCGKVSVEMPKKAKVINVKSTEDMYNAVMAEEKNNDIFIMSAAPADYRVENKFDNKVKDKELTIKLVKNKDIAKALGEIKGNRKLVVFAAETEDLIKNAENKLKDKNADLIVANDVTKEGAGFNVDTNIATIIYKDNTKECLDIMSKKDLANRILDGVLTK